MNTLRQLRNLWIPWVTTIALACSSTAVAQESHRNTQNIITFSAPGAGTGAGQGTGGFGINPQGTVVGSFLDDGNVFHGYQCVSGCGSLSTFTTFNAPGAGTAANQGTITFSINLFGVTTGYYIDASGVSHGFVTAAPFRTFTSFDPEGSVSTVMPVASGLSLEGEVDGAYLDASGAFHGFVRAGDGTITEFN